MSSHHTTTSGFLILCCHCAMIMFAGNMRLVQKRACCRTRRGGALWCVFRRFIGPLLVHRHEESLGRLPANVMAQEAPQEPEVTQRNASLKQGISSTNQGEAPFPVARSDYFNARGKIPPNCACAVSQTKA